MSTNANPWILHVKAYRQLHGGSYKDALLAARRSYQTGGASAEGMIHTVHDQLLAIRLKYDIRTPFDPVTLDETIREALSYQGTDPRRVESLVDDVLKAAKLYAHKLARAAGTTVVQEAMLANRQLMRGANKGYVSPKWGDMRRH